MSGDTKLNVFVSYSHKDEAWLERVRVHLKPLARDGKLDLWDDTGIKAGQRWRGEIKAALARADVAVLLISADFYASDFIANNELPPLLEAARSERGLVIAGLHISYSRFDRDEVLSEYQTVNTPNQPIEDLSRAQQEKVFDRLARRIEELVPLRRKSPEKPPLDDRDHLVRMKGGVAQERNTADMPGQVGGAAVISLRGLRFSKTHIIILIACLLVSVLMVQYYSVMPDLRYLLAYGEAARDVEQTDNGTTLVTTILNDLKSPRESVRREAYSQLALGLDRLDEKDLGLLADTAAYAEDKPIRIDATQFLVGVADPRIVNLALKRIPAASDDGKFNLILLIKGAFDRLPPADQERVARDLRVLNVGPRTRELINSFAP